nr:hypothetical protein [Tanacetum cinerariifolium]
MYLGTSCLIDLRKTCLKHQHKVGEFIALPSTTQVVRGDQAAPVAVEPSVQESRKKGREGIDANAPPKSLRRDHADLQPSGVPADVSDPDPLAFADAPSPRPADVVR